MTDLRGKVAIVTGAASGIGRATALRFAADGASVYCADINEDGAQQIADEILRDQGRAGSAQLDVSDEDAFAEAIAETGSKFGALDILFNNAGIGGGNWDRTVAVNLSGVYYGLTHGADYMARNGGGSIINTASIAGLIGLLRIAPPEEVPTLDANAGISSYSAAKHGVVGLTRQFALVYARHGVRVNAICPGYIETPMTEGLRSTAELVRHHEGLHPMGRLGQPEEIASAAAFLASDDSSFITGIALPVDGGYTAR